MKSNDQILKDLEDHVSGYISNASIKLEDVKNNRYIKLMHGLNVDDEDRVISKLDDIIDDGMQLYNLITEA